MKKIVVWLLVAASSLLALFSCGSKNNPANPPQLSVPVLVAPANDSTNLPDSVTLRWDTVTGAQSYGLEVSTVSSFSIAAFQESNLTSSSRTIGPLIRGTLYYWHVNQSGAAGISRWSDAWRFSTIPVSLPDAPVLSAPPDNALNQPSTLSLSWNAVSGASQYGIQVSTSADFSTTVMLQSGLSGTSKTLTQLPDSSRYFWRVNDVDGTSGTTSDWSGVWSFTVGPVARPGIPIAVSPANDTIDKPLTLALSWRSPDNAQSFGLQVSVRADFSTTVFGQNGLTAVSRTVGPLARNTTFYWRVNESIAGITGDWSALWTFTTQAVTRWDSLFMFSWGSFGSATGCFNEPVGIAVDRNGNVYVADGKNHRVQKFDASGKFLMQCGGVGEMTYPYGIALDSAGHVYVSDLSRHYILKYDLSGPFPILLGTMGHPGNDTSSGAFNAPGGIAVDRKGHVFVTEMGSTFRIQEFDSTGIVIRWWGEPGNAPGQFDVPIGIALDYDGNIYVTERFVGRIQKFDSTGTYIASLGVDALSQPSVSAAGLAADENGNLYVIDNKSSRILVFNSSGNLLSQWGRLGTGFGEFNSPWGIAVAPSARVYVTDNNNNRVQCFKR